MKIITKVYANKVTGQKSVNIPMKCNIEAGEFVMIQKTKKKKACIID